MTKRDLLIKKIDFYPESMIEVILDFAEFLEQKKMQKYYIPQTSANGVAAFFQKWPGNETDEEWNQILERLS
ncbi:MAG: hypothetical protein HUU50_15250 [Candidatus Brocadiae bacterium]|nr:hypothetical protein [Candidatus Brocadiia bacterium]